MFMFFSNWYFFVQTIWLFCQKPTFPAFPYLPAQEVPCIRCRRNTAKCYSDSH